MSKKIIGITVGTQLPKPNFKQTDPTKGDYIKNKPDFEGLESRVSDVEERLNSINAEVDTTLSIEGKAADAKATGDAIQAISALVGDEPVATQITDAIADVPQPDWNQNDTEAPDYIKNRTHWEEGDISTLIDNVTINVDSHYGVICPFTMEIVEGAKYIVTLDDVAYECTGYKPEDSSIAIGNAKLVYGEHADGNNEPFCIEKVNGKLYLDTKTLGEHTLLVQLDSRVFHKINEKYLPENLVKISDIITPDWNQNDPTAKDYIKNRTHWIEANGESITLIDNLTIEIGDGWTEESIELELIEGNGYIVTWDGVEYRCVAYTDYDGCIALGNAALGSGNNEPFFIEIDGGAWIASQSSGPHTLSIRTDSETVHKIDIRYLPENIVTKEYANATYTHPTYIARTGYPTANDTPSFGSTFSISQVKSDSMGHVSSLTTRTVKIPNTTATTSAAGLMSSADKIKLNGIETGAEVNVQGDWNQNDPTAKDYIKNRTHWIDGTYKVLVDNITVTTTGGQSLGGQFTIENGFIVGTTYTVTWDNIKYTCISYTLNGMSVIGSGSYMGTTGGNGEPFLMFCSGSAGVLFANTGTHTFSIAEEGIIHKVDSKYLPDFPKNILDGIASGSLRQVSAALEGTTSGYYLGENAAAFGEGTMAVGKGSFAHGGAGARAVQDYSHAEGTGTYASGYYSHAEGYNAQATGASSHAEGGTTTASGDYSHAEGAGTIASSYSSHAEGDGSTASGDYSHAEGQNTTASGIISHAEGVGTTASGAQSHAEGAGTKALKAGTHAEGSGTTADADYAHAEGGGTTASGAFSHAEGSGATASGYSSHAEGAGTTASGSGSHAEGLSTESKGMWSHAEGDGAISEGNYSHAEGCYTIAKSEYQHVQGKYNIEDADSAYAYIVGNGTKVDARSNAHTLDWDGNAYYAGDVYVQGDGSTFGFDGKKKLATETYVDTKVAELVESAPETLNTLNELAAALGNDSNFATTVANQIGNKVDKIEGKVLSTNDYTTVEKEKLANIAEGANKTVVDSALSGTSTNPVQNKAVNAAISNLNTLVGNTSVESQIADAIVDKAEKEHTHTISELTDIGDASVNHATTADTANAVAWGKVTGKPSTFTPATHTHAVSDVADLQNQLNAKVPTNRTVNGKALSANITLSASDVGADASGSANTALTNAKSYTDAEIAEWVGNKTVSAQIESAVSTKADTNHAHDDRYYTETEINTKLSGKSDTSHTHSNYVNQNAFSNIKVGETTVSADSVTDTVTLVAGNNVTITPDATNDKITIEAKDTIYTHPNSGVTAGTYKSVTVNAQGHVTGGSNPTTLSGYGITDAATKSHTHTAAQVGADPSGSADTALATAKSYVDTKISDLINSAPTTLDTLGEIATAMAENEDVVAALEESIGTKAKASDLTSHTGNKSNPHGVTLSQLGVTATAAELNYVDGVTSNIQTQLNDKADKTQGVIYIEGAGTTDTTNKVATWTGTHNDITAYYSGLTILYKVATAGSTTTTLNINNLGAVKVVRNATTAISTACPINGVLLLTYTTDSDGTSYWKTADYDSNTKTTTGTSNKANTKLYLAGATSQTSSGATTYSNSKCYIGTDNCLYSNSAKVATSAEVTAVSDALAALGIPTPTTADAGKILRVNAQGKYELVSLPNAEEATF